MQYDLAVIGGSFAGLSAAMQAARARRKVLVIDAGVSQAGDGATHHHRIGVDEGGKLLGGKRVLWLLGHVDENVQGGGQSAVAFHVTYLVTISKMYNFVV